MSSLSVELALNGDCPVEGVKVGVKRKRTPSSSGEEGENSDSKRKELPNGAITTVASPSKRKEAEDEEKVAILDAGAQYGKVGGSR